MLAQYTSGSGPWDMDEPPPDGRVYDGEHNPPYNQEDTQGLWDFPNVTISEITPTGSVFTYFGLFDYDSTGSNDHLANYWASISGSSVLNVTSNDASPFMPANVDTNTDNGGSFSVSMEVPVQQVPEPGAGWLLGLGAAAMFFTRRRERSS